MSHVRQVEQILLPLIKMAGHTTPNIVFLVGGKGPLRSDFERFVSNYGGTNILYVGYIPYKELADYVAACDFTLCSLDNSSVHGRYMLSRKISESLSVGVPMIATKTPAVQGFFGCFKSLRMVDNTPEAFMEAMAEISRNLEAYKSAAKLEASSVMLSLQESSRRIVNLLMSCF